MKNLSENELRNISGGLVLIVIGIAKGIAWIAGVVGAVSVVAYGAGYAAGKGEC